MLRVILNLTPLTSEEVNSIGNHINLIKEEMSPSGISAIENKDFYYIDEDGEEVTCINIKEMRLCFFVIKIILQNALLNQHIEKTRLISINPLVVIYIQ